MAPPATAEAPTADLARRVAALDWYHVLDLAPGVTTPGHFDLRSVESKVPLPASLKGRRCLDVGTWDGFWAFAMERRGADEVVAVDVLEPADWDWPPEAKLDANADYLAHVKRGGAGFALAREALASRVERLERSIYALDPDELGRFDVVVVGALLLHLRDPVAALARVREVCRGELVLVETIELLPTLLRPRTPLARLEGLGKPWWWQANAAALRRMTRSAGFEVLGRTAPFVVPFGPAHPRGSVRDALRGVTKPGGPERTLALALKGLPHVALRVVPR